MAYAFKRNNIWYVRYKDETNTWSYISCGKDANKTDADYRELARHVRIRFSITLKNPAPSGGDWPCSRSRYAASTAWSSLPREKIFVIGLRP
jgi:hypothetical protein